MLIGYGPILTISEVLIIYLIRTDNVGLIILFYFLTEQGKKNEERSQWRNKAGYEMQTDKKRLNEVEREELQRKTKAEESPKIHQQYLDAPREVFPMTDNSFGVFL